MLSIRDLTNQRFGHLLVVERADDYVTPKGDHFEQWRCLCDCGKSVITRTYSLLSGHTKGCGQKHRRYEDLTGRVFGKLTVLNQGDDEVTKSGTRHIRWNCRCECGETTLVRGTSLRSGHTSACKSCGRRDANLGKHVIDITGQKYGRWTVLYENGRVKEPRGRYVKLWRCRCECGEERDLQAGTLKQGLSLSCGCFKYERLSEIVKQGVRSSNLERIVNAYLTNRDVYYESQKIFPDLRGDSGYPLSYDFLVYTNGHPDVLIECQGRQHYEPVEYFGGQERFEVQQKNDAIKRKYASDHGLRFLEIPYTVSENTIIQLLNDIFVAKGSV